MYFSNFQISLTLALTVKVSLLGAWLEDLNLPAENLEARVSDTARIAVASKMPDYRYTCS